MRQNVNVKPGPLARRAGWRLPQPRVTPQLAHTMVPPNNPDDQDRLFHELERRAFDELPADEEPEPLDVLSVLRPDTVEPGLQDLTLGGYIERHQRVPAFEGIDAQPYTVDVDAEPAAEGGGYVAFLIFVRWAATGAGIMDHTESRDVARGATEAEAKAAALELSLYEVKAELDRAIERRRQALEDE